ncbi:putative membrane protein [Francisella tularensis subsp. holarctica]|nr:putative membrane protein [Francisella tularensis]KIP29903.1 putative membrane protein [Francisella tularensis subsp. holarctica]
MITLGYVIYDCIANASILIFAFLLYKKITMHGYLC